MSLTKDDLAQISLIVKSSEERMTGKIAESETRLEGKIVASEQRTKAEITQVRTEIVESEKRILDSEKRILDNVSDVIGEVEIKLSKKIHDDVDASEKRIIAEVYINRGLILEHEGKSAKIAHAHY